MIIEVIKESRPGETGLRDASHRGAAAEAGYDIVVEAGAGAESSFPDEAYVAAGATIGDALAPTSCWG